MTKNVYTPKYFIAIFLLCLFSCERQFSYLPGGKISTFIMKLLSLIKKKVNNYKQSYFLKESKKINLF